MKKTDLTQIKLNQTELARLFGVSTPLIVRLIKDHGFPVQPKGGYVLTEAVQTYINLLKKEKDHAQKNKPTDSKTALITAKARMAELELAKEMRETITVDDAINELTEVLSAMKSKILAIPTRASTELVNMATPAEVEAELRKYVTDALYELSTITERLKDLKPKDE